MPGRRRLPVFRRKTLGRDANGWLWVAVWKKTGRREPKLFQSVHKTPDLEHNAQNVGLSALCVKAQAPENPALHHRRKAGVAQRRRAPPEAPLARHRQERARPRAAALPQGVAWTNRCAKWGLGRSQWEEAAYVAAFLYFLAHRSSKHRIQNKHRYKQRKNNREYKGLENKAFIWDRV